MAEDKGRFWEIKGDKIVRTRKHCPKCGPGVYMAKHYDRMHCGKCSYTIWKKGQRSSSTTKRKKKPQNK